MNETEARRHVEQGLSLLNHWLEGVCEVEGVRRPLSSLRVCVRCGKTTCSAHGQLVRKDWLDRKHFQLRSIITCRQNMVAWGADEVFGYDFAASYVYVLINMLTLSPSNWKSRTGLFCTELMEKLQEEGGDFERMKARGGLYPVLSIKQPFRPSTWEAQEWRKDAWRDELWVCSTCAEELQVSTRQITEAARQMAIDITKRQKRQLADEVYREQKMSEARELVKQGKYERAVRLLEDWRKKRGDLFGEDAQALLREAERLLSEEQERESARRLAEEGRRQGEDELKLQQVRRAITAGRYHEAEAALADLPREIRGRVRDELEQARKRTSDTWLVTTMAGAVFVIILLVALLS